MTRLTAKDAWATWPKQASKMGNKPVWECERCLAYTESKPDVKCNWDKHSWIKFDSKREWKRWHELVMLEKAGQIRNLRRQVSYRLEVNGRLICTYRSDASYDEKRFTGYPAYDDEWQAVVEDSKGYATAVYKLKAKLMAAGACPEFPGGILIRET